MIALDSSVLLRYLLQDDPRQGAVVSEFIESVLTDQMPGYISTVVLLETLWVLRRGYRLSGEQVVETASAILATRQFVVEQRTLLHQALLLGHADLADRLIHELGRQAGCTETVSFDRGFARLPGVRLLEV